MATVKFEGPINVITNYPFRCIFNVEGNGETFKCALVGHLGETVSKYLKEGDTLELRGHWITEKSLGELFIIENLTMPEEARTGRMIKIYA